MSQSVSSAPVAAAAFSPREVAQYVEIYTRWWNYDRKWHVSEKPFARKRFSAAVVRHALAFRFLVRSQSDPTRLEVSPNSFLTALDLPDEVLWALVKPAVEKHSGFSITRHKVWSTFNFDKGDVGQIEQALFRLHQAGFVHFQSSGSLWRIEQAEAETVEAAPLAWDAPVTEPSETLLPEIETIDWIETGDLVFVSPAYKRPFYARIGVVNAEAQTALVWHAQGGYYVGTFSIEDMKLIEKAETPLTEANSVS